MNKSAWMINDTELALALGLPVQENIVTESEKRCVVMGQRLLLKYIIANPTPMNLTRETIIRVVYISKLEQMLKQLEKGQ